MKKRSIKAGHCIVGAIFVSLALITSCQKNNSGPSGPKPPSNPGGYDSSNQIQSSNLQAFWSLNGTLNDSKGGLVGTNSGSTFTSGMLNGTQAYQGSATAYSYASYTSPGTALPALQSFTVSVWIKASQPMPNPNPTVTAGLGEQAFFQIVNDSAWQSNLHLGLTPFTSAAGGVTTPNSDTLQLKIILSNFTSGIQWGTYYVTAFLDTAVNKWTNVAVTYSASSSMMHVYENGTEVAITGPYTTYPGSVGLELYQSDPGAGNANNAAGWGPLVFKNATSVVLGGWSVDTNPALSFAGVEPWAGNYTGAMERLRVYNAALNSTDIKSLYLLELSGF